MAEKSTFGLPRNTAAVACYVGGWVTGLIFLLTEKEDAGIRFHAMQSVVTFGVLNALIFVPGLGILLFGPVTLTMFVLWLVLIVKAYQGEEFQLPIVGEFARKQLERMK